MILAMLALLGVPLWFIAIALFTLLWRNRAIRKRPGNVPVRIHAPGEKRWSRGHGVWVHDVFAFRGSPAMWRESLLWVIDASVRSATAEERKKLHRLDEEPVIATFALDSGGTIEFAARSEQYSLLLGPCAIADGAIPHPRQRLRSQQEKSPVVPMTEVDHDEKQRR
jgi:hypothetical protein